MIVVLFAIEKMQYLINRLIRRRMIVILFAIEKVKYLTV